MSCSLVEVTTVDVSVMPVRRLSATAIMLVYARIGITVALADAPGGVELEKFLDCLLPERCRAGEEESHATQVVLLEVVFAAEHADDNGGNLYILATVDSGQGNDNRTMGRKLTLKRSIERR